MYTYITQRRPERLYATSDRVRMLPVDEDEDRPALKQTISGTNMYTTTHDKHIRAQITDTYKQHTNKQTTSSI